jgi:hypothetical protein
MSFAGDADRASTNVATFQPSVALALDRADTTVDLADLGVRLRERDLPDSVQHRDRKVVKIGKTIVNVTAEPQFTVFHSKGPVPTFQFFTVTLQWKKAHHPKPATPA